MIKGETLLQKVGPKGKKHAYKKRKEVGLGIFNDPFTGDVILDPGHASELFVSNGSQRERRGMQQEFREIGPRIEVGESSKQGSKRNGRHENGIQISGKKRT
ncbi:hypothetical protein SLEP1_g9621 [Rubroshorea leprosula]|uniref:Uncharacterized protein n=1 Tax=Rubroshorea leprosula TaxID=152421 RepID=A0AAV5IBF3_9ROSI|nr:hypothetical protein SLEP1_g9621 [Rubroshorea leprosula]